MSTRERVPPQHLEAERAVLGAMLLDREAVPRAVEVLSPDDFYRDAHRRIFLAMVALFEREEPVDVVTLQARLAAMGDLERVGGVSFLLELANDVPTAANVGYHARLVADKALLRAMIEAATEIAARGYEGEDDAHKLVDEAQERIMRLAERRTAGAYQPLKRVLVETFDHIAELYRNPGVTGVASGFPGLDRLTAGFQPSDLIVLAARPSMGKTALFLNIARHAALVEGVPTAVFSLEMSREQLALRLLCAEANIDSQRIRRGEVERDEWQKLSLALSRLAEAPIFIDDSPSLTALDIRARARRLKSEHKLGLVIVDYLQLMQSSSAMENRQQEISAISRSLKALARELRVPVLAGSQLSRAVESRQDRRPMLSDLRESGAIEQDSDVVAFIYRDDYYNPESDQPNVAEIIIAKQRNGPTGSLRLHFAKEIGKFYPLETGAPPEPRQATSA